MDSGQNDSGGSSPPVTVVVVNYNGMRHIQTCISSILRTEYPAFDVVLVDNGSTDGSVDYVRSAFPSVRVLALPRNVGSTACAIAIRDSITKYVALLNNDIEADRWWLRHLVDAMEKDERIGIADSKYLDFFDRERLDRVSGAGRFVDRVGNVYPWRAGEIDDGTEDKMAERFLAQTLFRRTAALEACSYDEDYFFGYEDVDISWRVRLAGYSIVYVPRSILYHKGGGTTRITRRLVPGFYYLTKRNQLLTLFKNYDPWNLIKVAPLVGVDLFVTLSLWAVRGERGRFLELTHAVFWFLRNLRFACIKRNAVQYGIRMIGDESIIRLMLPYSRRVTEYGRMFRSL